VLLAVLVVAIGTACGGGGGVQPAAHERVSPTRRPAASGSVRAPSTRVQPVGVEPPRVLPAPNVIDRGTDYAAIAGSLLVFGRWLEGRNPDPALVERAYQLDSPPGRFVASQLEGLRRIGARVVEVDRKPFRFTTTSITGNVVTLRLTEYLAHRDLVDAHGRVLQRDPTRTEYYEVSIRRTTAATAWRLNVVDARPADIEVQL
jgi:hypothetical protein